MSVVSCTKGANIENSYNTVPQETDASFYTKNIEKKYQSQNHPQRMLSLDEYALQEERKLAVVKHVGNKKITLNNSQPNESFLEE